MNESIPTATPAGRSWVRRYGLLVVAIPVLLFLMGLTAYQAWAGTSVPASASVADAVAALGAAVVCRAPDALTANHPMFPPISAALLEQRYGIRILLIALTAGGGIVDFRFKVLDLSKAKALLDDHEAMPMLMLAENNRMLRGPSMSHKHKYKTGGQYFFQYANSGNAVAMGTQVMAMFGKVTVDPVTVVR